MIFTRVYINRSRGYALLLRLWRWDILIRRHRPGERWRAAPPEARAVEQPLLEGEV